MQIQTSFNIEQPPHLSIESDALNNVTLTILNADAQRARLSTRDASPDPDIENDLDSCDVEIENPTPDEDLPPAEGGVA